MITKDQHEIRIAAERKRTGVSEVRLHHVPNAYRLHLIRRFGTGRVSSSGWWALQHALKDYSQGWLDHCGSTVIDGETVFVSEPYLNPNDVPEVRRFARDAGFTVEFCEASWWNPPYTIRIVFRLANDAKR